MLTKLFILLQYTTNISWSSCKPEQLQTRASTVDGTPCVVCGTFILLASHTSDQLCCLRSDA